MNTRDINKINILIGDEIFKTIFHSPYHQLRQNQTFSYIDKVKYYEIVENHLEQYIIEKLQQMDNLMVIPNEIEINYQSLNTLFSAITSFEERQNIFENFCSYVVNILTQLQGYEIIWEIQDDEKYIEQFTIKCSEDVKGIIDSIYIHKDSELLKVFIYLLNVLKLECYHMEGYSKIPTKIKK